MSKYTTNTYKQAKVSLKPVMVLIAVEFDRAQFKTKDDVKKWIRHHQNEFGVWFDFDGMTLEGGNWCVQVGTVYKAPIQEVKVKLCEDGPTMVYHFVMFRNKDQDGRYADFLGQL